MHRAARLREPRGYCALSSSFSLSLSESCELLLYPFLALSLSLFSSFSTISTAPFPTGTFLLRPQNCGSQGCAPRVAFLLHPKKINARMITKSEALIFAFLARRNPDTLSVGISSSEKFLLLVQYFTLAKNSLGVQLSVSRKAA